MSELKEHINNLEAIIKYLQLQKEEDKTGKLSEFTDMRFLAKSDNWPLAIDPDLIASNEKEKFQRAESILEEIPCIGKKLLDYGCGEGHATQKAIHYGASLSVGYDIKPHKWETSTDKISFTDKLPETKFDIILANDVLDHTKSPVETLKELKSLKSPDGKIYMRCHPWTSRHGTHLYKQLNRAYLQLVFNEEELAVIGLVGLKTCKPLDPVSAYKEWISESGLNIINEYTRSQPIEPFFKQPNIMARIKNNWMDNENIMQVQFVDFVLS